MKNITTKFFLIALLAVILIFLESCTVAKLSGKGTHPLILNQPQAKVNVIQKVNASKQLLFDYTGAVDVSEVLRDVMIGSDVDAVINITITIKQTVGDFFINVFTLGLANARTFEVNGDVVKAPEGLSLEIFEDKEPIAVYKTLDEIKLPAVALNTETLLVKDEKGYTLYEYVVEK